MDEAKSKGCWDLFARLKGDRLESIAYADLYGEGRRSAPTAEDRPALVGVDGVLLRLSAFGDLFAEAGEDAIKLASETPPELANPQPRPSDTEWKARGYLYTSPHQPVLVELSDDPSWRAYVGEVVNHVTGYFWPERPHDLMDLEFEFTSGQPLVLSWNVAEYLTIYRDPSHIQTAGVGRYRKGWIVR